MLKSYGPYSGTVIANDTKEKLEEATLQFLAYLFACPAQESRVYGMGLKRYTWSSKCLAELNGLCPSASI